MSDERHRHIDDDLMSDALLRLLSAAQLDSVFDHLDNCAECETRFREAASRFETLRAESVGAQPATVGSTGRDDSTRTNRWRAVVRALWPRPALVTAAVVAVLALVVLNPLQRRHNPGIVAWIPVDGEILEKRSAAGTAGERFWSGLEAYRERRAGDAVEELTAATVTGPYRDLRDIYLASALVNSSRFEEALGLVEALKVDDLPQPWRDEARWVRAVALMETGDTEAGIATMEQLADSGGAAGDRARTYLEKRR